MVDILSLLIAVHITPVDVQGRDGFAPVLSEAKLKSPRLEKVPVDGALRGEVIDQAAVTHGVTVEVILRPMLALGSYQSRRDGWSSAVSRG